MAHPASTPEQQAAFKKKQAEESARYKARVLTRAMAVLDGRTINGVEVETSYDRTHALILKLSDGYRVHISHWAANADDSALSFELLDPYMHASSEERQP